MSSNSGAHRSGDQHPSGPQALATTRVQRAYLIGREPGQPMGGVDCLGYIEFDESDVEPHELQAAVEFAQRHPALRASLPTVHELVDVDAPAPRVEVHDFSGAEDLENALAAVRDSMAATYFDLSGGRSWAIALSRLPQARSIVHLAIALTVADVAGICVLCDDLARYIAASREGTTEEIDGTRIEFSDIARAQAGTERRLPSVDDEVIAGRVAGMYEPPALPMRDEHLVDVAATVSRFAGQIGASTWDRIGTLATELKVTRAAIMLSAFAESLRRWSAESDFIVTIPGLSTRGTQQHIADRTRLYAIRCTNDAERSAAASFTESANEMRYRIAADVDAVDELRDAVASGTGHSGMSPYVFTYSAERPLLSGAVTDVLGSPTLIRSSTPQVLIDCQVYEFVDDHVDVSFDVRDGALADGVAEQVFDTFVEAAMRIAGCEAAVLRRTALADLVALPDRVSTARASLNAVQPNPPGLLHDGFLRSVERHPDQTAIIVGDRHADPVALMYPTLDYAQVDALARTLAARLQRATEPGDLVGLELPAGPAQIIAVLGVLYAGCAYLPLPIDLPPERREAILAAAVPASIVTLADIPREADIPDGFTVTDALPGDHAYVIFTSGSTGIPKGVVMSHAAAANTVRDVCERNGIGPGDVSIAVAALAFDLSVFDIFGMLGAGATVITLGEETARDPFLWNRLALDYDASVWNSAPMVAEMFLEAADELPHLRVVMCSGDRIDLGLGERIRRPAPHARLVAMGGATEGGIWSNEFVVTAGTVLDPDWTSVPYGVPLAGQQYRVSDERGRDSGAHVVGELWIGGASLATAYLGNPEVTAERFIEVDGVRWYRTGDLGRWDAQNVLIIQGRNDSQVKIRGHRIELGDVEAHLRAIRGVADAVVFPIRNRTALSAAVSLDQSNTGATLSGEQLAATLAEVLPAYMIPASIRVLDALPVTSNGKVDRAALSREAATVGALASGPAAPGGELVLVISAFGEVLGTQVKADTNFFAAGGESLGAARVCRRLHDAGFRVGVVDLLRSPTADGLAEVLRSRGPGESQAVPQRSSSVDRSADFPLTPLQRGYALGRDGITGQVRAATTLAVIFELAPAREVAEVHAAAQILTTAWDGLRTRRTADSRQRIVAGVEVPLIEIEGSLRDHLPTHLPVDVIDVVVARSNSREVGVVIDYLALDARSLVTVMDALADVVEGRPVPLSVESELDEFIGYATTEPEPARIDGGVGTPLVPTTPIQDTLVHFASRRLMIADVEGLHARARAAGVTPTVVVLHAFGGALAETLGHDRVSVTIPVSYRPTESVAEVLGNFTRLQTVVVDEGRGVAAVAVDVAGTLDADGSAVPTLHRGTTNQIVFTSTLGLSRSAGPDAALVPVWSLTSTPGVLIDCQVLEHRNGIEVRWDYPAGVTDEGFLDRAQRAFARRLGLPADDRVPDRAFECADDLIAAVAAEAGARAAAGTRYPPAMRAVIDAMARDRREPRSGPTGWWPHDDATLLLDVLGGQIPESALLDHPRLAPDVLLRRSPAFGRFVSRVADDIAAIARRANRPVRVVELGTVAASVMTESLRVQSISHTWVCVEPDRLLAHIAFRRGIDVRTSEFALERPDVVVIGASAHRDPRILRIARTVVASGPDSVWLCEPSADSATYGAVTLLSAAILDPTVLDQHDEEPLWHWLTALRELGLTPFEAADADGLVTVGARSRGARIRTAAPASTGAPVCVGHARSAHRETVADAWRACFDMAETPTPDTDFFDAGGDSLRGTKLVVLLHERGLNQTRLVDIFNHPRLADLTARIGELHGADVLVEPAADEPTPSVDRSVAQSIPLTAVQRAYLAGSDPEQILGGVDAHCYFEFVVDDLDHDALARAVDVVVSRHDVLRARVVDSATAQIVEQHRESRPIRTPDACALTETERVDPRSPGALRVRVAPPLGHTSTVAIGLDNLWLDGASMFRVLAELGAVYRGVELPPAPSTTIADYLRTHPDMVQPSAPDAAVDEVIADLPPVPRIWSGELTDVHMPTFDRAEATLDMTEWAAVRTWAAANSVSATAVVLAAFGRALANWVDELAVTVNITQFDRDLAVPGVAGLTGDFTRLFVLGVDAGFDSPATGVGRVQADLVKAFDEPQRTAAIVSRRLLATRGRPAEALFPVVFTSGLGLLGHEASGGDQRLLGPITRVRSQTPQTVLDLQATDTADGLSLTVDYVTELIGRDAAQQCVRAVAGLVRDFTDQSAGAAQPDETAQIRTDWSRVLGVESVTPDTNFFTAGGDSLKATDIMRRLADRGSPRSLRVLLENPRFGDFLEALGADVGSLPGGYGSAAASPTSGSRAAELEYEEGVL